MSQAQCSAIYMHHLTFWRESYSIALSIPYFIGHLILPWVSLPKHSLPPQPWTFVMPENWGTSMMVTTWRLFHLLEDSMAENYVFYWCPGTLVWPQIYTRTLTFSSRQSYYFSIPQKNLQGQARPRSPPRLNIPQIPFRFQTCPSPWNTKH